LEAAVGDGLVEVTSTEVPDDWADRWQDFHKPVWIGGGRMVVRPSWERGAGRDPAGADAGGEERAGIDVVVEPGQAFGTGAHPTTRMCLELLLELADGGEARGRFADWGTGSGVLAIAAAKLGFGPVVGCDHERAALDAAAANAHANDVDLDLMRVNLREAAPPKARTVTANLTAALLQEVAARMERPPDRLLCSGMLVSEVDAVAEAFAGRGLRERKRRALGDWAALSLTRT
jgi:ribosomal protein L11 methyltransferase